MISQDALAQVGRCRESCSGTAAERAVAGPAPPQSSESRSFGGTLPKGAGKTKRGSPKVPAPGIPPSGKSAVGSDAVADGGAKGSSAEEKSGEQLGIGLASLAVAKQKSKKRQSRDSSSSSSDGSDSGDTPALSKKTRKEGAAPPPADAAGYPGWPPPGTGGGAPGAPPGYDPHAWAAYGGAGAPPGIAFQDASDQAYLVGGKGGYGPLPPGGPPPPFRGGLPPGPMLGQHSIHGGPLQHQHSTAAARGCSISIPPLQHRKRPRPPGQIDTTEETPAGSKNARVSFGDEPDCGMAGDEVGFSS